MRVLDYSAIICWVVLVSVGILLPKCECQSLSASHLSFDDVFDLMEYPNTVPYDYSNDLPEDLTFIGVDLGESECRVAYWAKSGFTPISNERGVVTIPSVVLFTDQGVEAGTPFYQSLGDFPKSAIYNFWPLLGRNFTHPEVQRARTDLPYDIVNKDDRPVIQMKLQNRLVTVAPESILAALMLRLKIDIDSLLGESALLDSSVPEIAVSVPVHFDDAQKRAIEDAITQVGLQIERMTNQTMAMSYAYRLNIWEDVRRMIAFFDRSYNHDTVTIMSTSWRDLDVLGTATTHTDLLTRTEKQCRKEGPKELLLDYTPKDDLPWFLVHDIMRDKSVDKWQTYRVMIADHTNGYTVFQDYIWRHDDNSTSKLQFASSPIDHPGELSAKGAVRMPYENIDGWINYGVPVWKPRLSVGIGLENGAFMKILPDRDWPPRPNIVHVATTTDDQSEMRIDIFEGERLPVKHNRFIGTITMQDIERFPAGQNKFELMLDFVEDYRVQANLTEISSGRSTHLEIETIGYKLGSEPREKLFQEAREMREDDLYEMEHGDSNARTTVHLGYGPQLDCEYHLRKPEWVDISINYVKRESIALCF